MSNVELNELTVLTENLDSVDDRLPPIVQAKATKSCLKRKQGAQTLHTFTKEFLPSLNIKPPNLKTKMVVNGSQVSHLPVLVCKQGLTTKTTSPSTENANESLSSTPHEATTFSDVSPIIPRKNSWRTTDFLCPKGRHLRQGDRRRFRVFGAKIDFLWSKLEIMRLTRKLKLILSKKNRNWTKSNQV